MISCRVFCFTCGTVWAGDLAVYVSERKNDRTVHFWVHFVRFIQLCNTLHASMFLFRWRIFRSTCLRSKHRRDMRAANLIPLLLLLSQLEQPEHPNDFVSNPQFNVRFTLASLSACGPTHKANSGWNMCRMWQSEQSYENGWVWWEGVRWCLVLKWLEINSTVGSSVIWNNTIVDLYVLRYSIRKTTTWWEQWDFSQFLQQFLVCSYLFFLHTIITYYIY